MVHFGQRDLGHHSELSECAAAHEVEEALAFAGEAGRPVWHQAFALSEPEVKRRQISRTEERRSGESSGFRAFT